MTALSILFGILMFATALFLILLILVQRGRGGGLSGALGGMGGSSAFGAKAAKLMEYTDSRHYGVKLSDEDRHRLILWLDSNSEFYGSYEDIEAQARGEIVLPSLE